MTEEPAPAPASALQRLPWVTPRLEPLGTIADVHNDAGGNSDDDGFPMNAAS